MYEHTAEHDKVDRQSPMRQSSDFVCLQVTGQHDWHHTSSNRAAEQQPHASKQRGMAAELADILSQLDDATKLADELDFTVNSKVPKSR